MAAATSLPRPRRGPQQVTLRGSGTPPSSLLYRLGFEWEALEYFAFILEALSSSPPSDYGLQIMYGIGGEADLTERTRRYLSGYYRNGKPSCGWSNEPWDQHQTTW